MHTSKRYKSKMKIFKKQMGGIITSVLLIGVNASEIHRLNKDLHSELRTAQIYLLNPKHHVEMELPQNVHLITGSIPDRQPFDFPDMPVEKNFFDTISTKLN